LTRRVIPAYFFALAAMTRTLGLPPEVVALRAMMRS